MTNRQTIGILALGRPTFDVPFAEENLVRMRGVLAAIGHPTVGASELLLDSAGARAAADRLAAQGVDQVLVLQMTFTDAEVISEIARSFQQPLSIWAIPERRTGDRPRAFSFVGLNLAAYALGLQDRTFGYLYAAPDAPGIEQKVTDLLAGRLNNGAADYETPDDKPEMSEPVIRDLRNARIARIGAHPDGFYPCSYDKADLEALAGIGVEEFEIEQLFERARGADTQLVEQMMRDVSATVRGTDKVDQAQLRKSLQLKAALDSICEAGRFDALAVRCWPESFTEFGGAVCGPAAMLGDARIPCACEVDVYGALTNLLLQKVSETPVFLTDLVDLDEVDDTGVVWHCGQAPVSMADPETEPRATLHTNRKMPLLLEFALKTGRVTFMRLSQARGRKSMVVGAGEMLKRDRAYSGTCGVVRFDSGAQTVQRHLLDGGVEHHLALTYGDHLDTLEAVAARLDLPILRL